MHKRQLVGICGAAWMTALSGQHTPAAALDYFVVQGATATTNTSLYVFAYDTAARTVSLVSTNVRVSTGDFGKLSAGPNGAFWLGFWNGTPEGVERFVPNTGRTAWTTDFVLNIEAAGAGGFLRAGVRNPDATGLDVTRTGAAELSDGRFLVVDNKASGANRNAYAFSTVQSAWSDTITDAAFTNASGGWFGSAYALKDNGTFFPVVDAVATVAGMSRRFIVTGSTFNSSNVVMEAHNAFRGALTDITTYTYYSAVGTMKTAALGDVALLMAAPAAESKGTNCVIVGRSVAESDFDTVKIAEFTVASHNSPGVNPRWIEFSDVDGTQSGLIMVCGRARSAAGTDSTAVRFYNTDGTPHSDIFWLRDIVSDIGSGGSTITCPATCLWFAPDAPRSTVLFVR